MSTNKDYRLIDTFIFDESFDVDSIDLLDVIKLDVTNYMRLDLLILNKYGNRGTGFVENFLPFILAFNNIADYYSIQVGQIIKFPVLDDINESTFIELTDEQQTSMHGITDLFDAEQEINTSNTNTSNKSNNSGNTKLKIKLRTVKYDADSGIIRY